MISSKEKYEYLRQFLTEERLVLFNRLIQWRTRYLTVLLEDVYHPHNSNAVLRSCDCFGLCEMHVLESKYNYEISERISKGATKWTDAIRHHDIEEGLNHLKNRGFKIVATTPSTDAIALQELPIDQPLALIFGAEKIGISDFAASNADFKMYIPMQGFTESLNVSVAAALSMFELTNRIRTSKYPWQLSPEQHFDLLLEWAMKSVRSSNDLINAFIKQYGN